MAAPPTFTEFPGLSLTGVSSCSVAWGDCDNDGDLDLAIVGYSYDGMTTKVYENDGPGGFTELAGTSLIGVYIASLAWGDCDNDGDLDLAVAGSTGPLDREYFTKVYGNDGAGGFTDLTGTTLVGVDWGSLAWGDCDNDGDLDLAVAGSTGSGAMTTVYENDGAGGFTELTGTSLTGVRYCSLAWGDCDNDGDLDLAVAGWASLTTSERVTKVYENDGAGGFTELTGTSLTGVGVGCVAWGDCDGDGDLDLAVAGETGSGSITKVYENDGAGGFTELTGTSLKGVFYCSLAWGDCDNDGDLDLAVAGATDAGDIITTVYRNDGAGGFTEFPDLGLTGVQLGCIAWGDADNDGDLDLAIAGAAGSEWITTVYENKGPLPNKPPGRPAGLAYAGRVGDRETLAWEPAADAETPTEGLSYNLMIREASGMTHVFPAMADETTGARRVPAFGPVVSRDQYILFGADLAPGDYEACVQAIDSGLEGGPWSEPCLFTVP